MKVILLGDPSSPHMIKWANGIHSKGVDILVFGFSDFDSTQYNKGIKVEAFKIPDFIRWLGDGNLLKSLYILSVPKLKKIIKKYNCDVLHAQYASSYGLLATLTNFHPLLLQVWGGDVYNFPPKSFLHEKIIRYNLSNADMILSTSQSMLLQTKKFTDKQIEFMYLGIDVEKFKPMEVVSLFEPDDIVIGTIKTLDKQYGIDYLIKAFKVLKERLPSEHLKLLIVGRGPLEYDLKKLVQELNLEEDTVFTGFIPPSEIPKYYNMLDVFVALSVMDGETFGVAVIEASACEKPVVVSNVGGLPEAVENNKSGFVVENKNYQQATNAIYKLVMDKKLNEEMGKYGRQRVIKEFNGSDKVDQMINLYKKLIENKSKL